MKKNRELRDFLI